MRDDIRMAWVIKCGERDGAKFDYETMSWMEAK